MLDGLDAVLNEGNLNKWKTTINGEKQLAIGEKVDKYLLVQAFRC